MISAKKNNKEEKDGVPSSNKQTNNGKVFYKKKYRRVGETC